MLSFSWYANSLLNFSLSDMILPCTWGSTNSSNPHFWQPESHKCSLWACILGNLLRLISLTTLCPTSVLSYTIIINCNYAELTWADNSCILLMPAVMPPPAMGMALPNTRFFSITVHLIQPDGPCSFPKMSRTDGINGPSTAQLFAHHVGIIQVPAVITDGAPGALMIDLYSPSTTPASIYQAKLTTPCKEKIKYKCISKDFEIIFIDWSLILTYAGNTTFFWKKRACWVRGW